MKTAVVNWKSDQIRGLLLTAILSISLLIKGQDYKIMKIITSQYPVVKATFLATGNTGEKITNALPEDFKITENNRKCDIIEVTNPREIAIPASIVLMFDVSLSMTGERLELAKKAAKGFIEQMPLETSEVAIASFSDEVYVNCDFTQNQERLFHAIDNLRSVGGTNYSKAFLDKGSGAISIAANGRHKKNIIFLTDGLSNTDVNEVVSQARQSNTTIYCITLELPIPDILRDISQQTGGTYFEAVANINQLDGIYSTIFQMLEVTKYGTVTWKANQDCRKEKNVHFVFRNKPVTFTYDIPKNKTGSLDIDPSVVAFGSALPGASKNVSIDLIARNIPLNITHIAIAGKGPFSLTDSIDMPYLLKPDHVKNITLNYKPKDTKIITDKLIISTRECPDKSVVLHGGSDEQLRLICPKGGEQLVVGTDTSIQWEGVKKEKTISIFYRTHPDKDWKQIGEGQNLILPWITPNDTSHQVQVMLKPKGNGNESLYLTSTIPNQRTGLRDAFFNRNNSRVIITDGAGIVKIWETETGRLLSTIQGFPIQSAFFSNNDSYITSFTKNETLIWDAETSKLLARQQAENKIIYTSQILPDGTECLITSNLSKDLVNTYRLWMPGINRIAMIFEKDYVLSASLTSDGSKALTLSPDNVLKIWDINKGTGVPCQHQPISPISIIINPNGKTAMIIGPGTLTMIDMKNGNELFHVQRFSFLRFSNSGDMIITRSRYDNNTVFLDSYTGKYMMAAGDTYFYKCLPTGYKTLFYKKDSLTITDIFTRKKIFRLYRPSVIDAVISPDEHKMMVITKSNVIDFFDITTGNQVSRIGDIDGKIRTALFSPDGKSILVIMDDNSLQYWSPQGSKQTDKVVSGYFTILSPKPVVKKMIRFDDQFISHPKEQVIKDFISNSTKFPVLISRIELIENKSTGFAIVSNPFPVKLKPGSQKTGEFRFIPGHSGPHHGWIRTCTPTDTFLTELVGNGITKNFETLSTDINFGKINILHSKDTLAAIIRNTGTAPLTITNISGAGPDLDQFTIITPPKNYSIQPGTELMVKIRFAPKYRGKTSGSLLVRISGIPENQYINLTGEGIASKEIRICGKTLNSWDSLPISANVRCNDLESGNIIQKFITDHSGYFTFKLNADRNYSLVAEKEGFLSNSENIDVRNATTADTVCRNIYLTEINIGASIRMNCIFFEFAKANLLESSKNELNRIVDLLNQYKNINIELQGHTDSIGSESSNMTLSNARADAVRTYLIKQGITEKRLSTRAFGESVPVASNSTAEGRQLNRRVELKIIKF